jgi:hypothetical protein
VGEFGGGCVVNSVSALSQEIFDISVTEIEAVVEPDGLADDIWWESMALVDISSTDSTNVTDLTWQYPVNLSTPSEVP